MATEKQVLWWNLVYRFAVPPPAKRPYALKADADAYAEEMRAKSEEAGDGTTVTVERRRVLPAKPLTVRVTLEIVIKDPDEWATATGTGTIAAIRQDVKDYAHNHVQGSPLLSEECDATVTLK